MTAALLPIGSLVTFKGVRGVRVPARVVEHLGQTGYLLEVTGRRAARYGYPHGDRFSSSPAWVFLRRLPA